MNLFLTSDDYLDFQDVKTITDYQQMTIDNQKVLKVKINKPLIGQKYNLNDFDPDALYLINRYDENAFDKLDVFPIHVYVLIPKTYTKRIPSALNDLQNIAWAMLYDNIIDAEIKKI